MCVSRSDCKICVRSSGTTPELQCIVSVQNFYRSRLAKLWLKAGTFRWPIGLPATSIKQQATESKGEPKFIIPISAE